MSNQAFGQAVDRFRLTAMQRADKVRKAVSKQFLSAVIRDTPVDTGRLRANWTTTVGAPSSAFTEEGFVSGFTPIDNAMMLVVDNSRFGDTVFMVNNTPYAHGIEYDGVSHTKAPEGMVRKNLSRFNLSTTLRGAELSFK